MPSSPPRRSGGATRRASGSVVAVALVAFAATGCEPNMLGGSMMPVPPVHRVPPDVSGRVILLDKDATIETRDAIHVLRANEHNVPRRYRMAMTNALVLAGFRVSDKPAEPHDLVAKLALAVSEDDDKVRQVYRCGVVAADGTKVAQIDWAWPQGTFVDPESVYDFATHNLATEVATSRPVLAWLRKGGARERPGGGGNGGASDDQP